MTPNSTHLTTYTTNAWHSQAIHPSALPDGNSLPTQLFGEVQENQNQAATRREPPASMQHVTALSSVSSSIEQPNNSVVKSQNSTVLGARDNSTLSPSKREDNPRLVDQHHANLSRQNQILAHRNELITQAKSRGLFFSTKEEAERNLMGPSSKGYVIRPSTSRGNEFICVSFKQKDSTISHILVHIEPDGQFKLCSDGGQDIYRSNFRQLLIYFNTLTDQAVFANGARASEDFTGLKKEQDAVSRTSLSTHSGSHKVQGRVDARLVSEPQPPPDYSFRIGDNDEYIVFDESGQVLGSTFLTKEIPNVADHHQANLKSKISAQRSNLINQARAQDIFCYTKENAIRSLKQSEHNYFIYPSLHGDEFIEVSRRQKDASIAHYLFHIEPDGRFKLIDENNNSEKFLSNFGELLKYFIDLRSQQIPGNPPSKEQGSPPQEIDHLVADWNAVNNQRAQNAENNRRLGADKSVQPRVPLPPVNRQKLPNDFDKLKAEWGAENRRREQEAAALNGHAENSPVNIQRLPNAPMMQRADELPVIRQRLPEAPANRQEVENVQLSPSYLSYVTNFFSALFENG